MFTFRANHLTGQLVKTDNNQAVYFCEKGANGVVVRRLIENWPTFLSLFHPTAIRICDDQDLQRVPEGADVAGGSRLVRVQGDIKIYFQDGPVLRHIDSMQALLGYNFNGAAVQTVTPQELQHRPMGLPVSAGNLDPPHRYDLADLRPGEWDAFVGALFALKANGAYDRYTQAHFDNLQRIHHTPLFLPWHRVFLYLFSRAIQDIIKNPTLHFPFSWQWLQAYPSYETDDVIRLFTPPWVGSAASPVRDGPFQEGRWAAYLPDRGVRNAPLGRSPSAKSVEVPADVVATLVSFSDYEAFRQALERTHDDIHGRIGGLMGDPHYSTNDPVFWLHHARVDEVWSQWQRAHPAQNDAMIGRGWSVSLGDIMPGERPWSVAEAALIDGTLVA